MIAGQILVVMKLEETSPTVFLAVWRHRGRMVHRASVTLFESPPRKPFWPFVRLWEHAKWMQVLAKGHLNEMMDMGSSYEHAPSWRSKCGSNRCLGTHFITVWWSGRARTPVQDKRKRVSQASTSMLNALRWVCHACGRWLKDWQSPGPQTTRLGPAARLPAPIDCTEA